MPKQKTDPVTAFHARYTELQNGCWEWTGMKLPRGYGVWQASKTPRGDDTYIRERIYAHRLSWEIHKGPVPEGKNVLHACDNPSCVNPKHLFLGTHQDNMRDRDYKARQARGEDFHRSDLTDDDARAILRSEETGFVLAERYGVSYQTINDIRAKRTWAHIADERRDFPAMNQAPPEGSKNWAAKLTETDIPVIRARLKNESFADVAKSYGVTDVTIRNIWIGKNWRHV